MCGQESDVKADKMAYRSPCSFFTIPTSPGREDESSICIESLRLHRSGCSASSQTPVPHFGNHHRVPPQLVLEPVKNGPRQRPEIPCALVLVLNILLDN